jgi:hypothetical protein
MTSISLHPQWPLTSQLHGSVYESLSAIFYGKTFSGVKTSQLFGLPEENSNFAFKQF